MRAALRGSSPRSRATRSIISRSARCRIGFGRGSSYTSAAGNVFDSGSYQAALARLLEVAGYARLRREAGGGARRGTPRGIGLACFVELTGPGAQFYGVGGAPISGQEGATIRLEPAAR